MARSLVSAARSLAFAGTCALLGTIAVAPPAAGAPRAERPEPGHPRAGAWTTPAVAAVAADEVAVRLRPGVSAAAAAALLHARGAASLDHARIGATRWLRVPTAGQGPAGAVTALRRDPRVLDAQVLPVRRAHEIPTDPYWWDEPPLYPGQESILRTARLPEAWDISHGSSGVVVAVLDTGVNIRHEDLVGRTVPGRDFVGGDADPADENGHGTAVAGVIAAGAGNGRGIAGVGWNTRVMPVRVLDHTGAGSDADIADGIQFAVNGGAKVINLSLGGSEDGAVLRDAVAAALRAGVVVVASAGNEPSAVPQYPSAYPGVLAVGATDELGRLAYFSSYGEHLALTAPGWGVLTLTWTDEDHNGALDDYSYADGTSFSAPIMAGVAALVRARFPSLTPAQVNARLASTARDSGPRGRDPFYGAGLVDAAAALGAPYAPALGFSLEPAGEPGDTPARAKPAPSVDGFKAQATLVPEGDVDWWTFTITAGGPHSIQVTPGGTADPNDARGVFLGVRLYDGAGRLVHERRPAENDLPDLAVGWSSILPAGTYQLRVANVGGATSTSPYAVSVASAVDGAALTPGPTRLVEDVAPAPNAAGVPLDAPVTVTFSTDVGPAAESAENVVLLDATTGASVAATRSYDPSARRLTLTPAAPLSPSSPYRVVVRDFTASTPEPGVATQWSFVTANPPGQRFVPLAPVRLLDTRAGVGAPKSPVPARGHVDLQVTGLAGVPASASAVVLNVTGVNPAAATFVQVYPTPATGSAVPLASNLNLAAGTIVPNLVTVKVGAGGKVRLRSALAAIDLVADVSGYYAASGAGFTPLAPTRVMDTRIGVGVRAGVVPANGYVDLPLATVPANAAAVVLNVTGIAGNAATFVRVFPTPLKGTALPNVSNLNLAPGQIAANLVTVKRGLDRKVRLHTAASVHLVADLAGYYTSSGVAGFVAVEPARVLDTRNGTGVRAGPVAAGAPVDLPVGPAPEGRAAAVVLNVTAVQPSASTYVRAYPTPAGGGSPPTVSTVNLRAGEIRSNLAVVSLGAGDHVRFDVASGTVDLVADQAGWFTRTPLG